MKESEKQLRSLSTQLLRAQETERKRISRELHDELGQSLLVMKLRLDFIEENLLSHQTELKRECEDGVQYIDQVIENIRRLSRDLSPAILEDFGLSAALRWLINNFAKRYNMKVMMDMTDIDSLLPPHSHIVVYRTVQEVLTNIGKHSQAKNVSISISENTDSISFSIVDDGIGFDEGLIDAKDLEARGLGLETMKGRCQMVGGVLKIWTKEGEGTRITLSVPVEARSNAIMASYSIILADDHVLVRQGLRRILEGTDDLEVVGEANDGLELLQLLKHVTPQMVILDIFMPNLRGIEAITEIKTMHPDVKILILTMHRDKEYLYLALSAGAKGYLLKEDAAKELFSAIAEVRQGKTYISPYFSDKVVNDVVQISERECQGHF